MARKRLISPEFFHSENMAQCSAHARLLFVGIWTIADKQGRLRYSAPVIRGAIFPFEPDLDIDALVTELVRVGSLVRYGYGAGGRQYLSIPGWEKWQKVHKNETDQGHPEPPKNTESGNYAIESGNYASESGNVANQSGNYANQSGNVANGETYSVREITRANREITRATREITRLNRDSSTSTSTSTPTSTSTADAESCARTPAREEGHRLHQGERGRIDIAQIRQELGMSLFVPPASQSKWSGISPQDPAQGRALVAWAAGTDRPGNAFTNCFDQDGRITAKQRAPANETYEERITRLYGPPEDEEEEQAS